MSEDEATAEAQPRREPSPWLLPLLAGLGLVGNVAAIPLFFGVDFLFGSVASLAAVRLRGPLWGVLVALVGSLYTVVLWQHPYAIVIFGAEAAIVGLVLARVRHNLVLAAALYWSLVGIPLVVLFYGGVMGAEQQVVVLVALKQALNGIVNALLASLLVDHTPLRAWSRHGRSSLTLRQVLFNALVGMVLFPALLLTVLNGRQELRRLEEDLAERLQGTGESLELHLETWVERQLGAVEVLAGQAPALRGDREALQAATVLVHDLHPDLHNLYVADASGTTIAFDPPVNDLGRPTIGLDFSDRPYFARLKTASEAVVTPVFVARGGVHEPIVAFAAPIPDPRGFVGYALGALDLDLLRHLLVQHASQADLRATIVDRRGHVVASSDPDLTAGQPYDRMVEGALQHTGPQEWRWMPKGQTGVPAVSRWRDSVLGRDMQLVPPGRWTLHVEAPVAPAAAWLDVRYARSLALMVGLVLLAILLSVLIAEWIARPLARLAAVSSRVPEALDDPAPVDWPRSAVAEVNSLARNFAAMTAALRGRLAELRAADRAKDDFLAMLAHELRNPLSAIAMGLHVLVERGEDRTIRAHTAPLLQRQVKNLGRLVDDLLDLSRITRGKIELRRQHLVLQDAAAAALESVRPLAEERRHTLHADIERSPLVVSADPTRLEQVFINLLHNAVKYTEPGGRIEASVRREREQVVFRVRDDGVGMTPALAERAFDLFQQGERPLDRSQGGLGIGLTLVRQLVEMHGGTVSASSPGPGQGSTFEVRLPVVGGAVPVAERPTDAAAPASEPRRVLVVDDNEDAAILLANVLEGWGHQVQTASDGPSGLELARSERPDVLLLDIGLPGLSGYEVAERLRAEPGFEDLRLIAVTGYGQEADRRRAHEAGFDAHLTKPVDLDVLRGLVEEEAPV